MKYRIFKSGDKLVRANWYVEKYLMQLIKSKAKKDKISESELVRRLLANKLN
jgi:hypothetical protein